MRLVGIIIFSLLNLVVCAQQMPKGVDIINANKLKFLNTTDASGSIAIQGKFNKTKPQAAIFKITTTKQPKFIYNLATSLPLTAQNYPKGSVFLLSFQAKTERASLETGEAKVQWVLKQSASHKANLLRTVSLASEWKTYYIPFITTEDVSANELGLAMQFGFRPQSFLITNIQFQSFPLGTKISDLPKTEITYAGMEDDAEWRKQALKRIDSLRKGMLVIRFTKEGKPITKQKIEIKLLKHKFKFGAALDAVSVVNNDIEYRQFKTLFPMVVLENDLKIKKWKKLPRKQKTLKALRILKQDAIEVKGHVLVWPGFNYLPQQIKDFADNPKKVTNLINNHVKQILKETDGFVSHWDVVNEAYTNKDLQKITGSEKILYNAFRIVKKVSPNVGRFTNEYGIISKGGIDTKKQRWYYNYIKRIDSATGGLVDGIGIQSHMGSDLTAPQKVLEILDYYAQLRKKISISEFTMDIQDAEVRAQYTRDFMIAAFSHPNVSEFLFWGCMDDERHKVDIVQQDGSLGVMGGVYVNLVKNKWNTHVQAKTNNNGVVTFPAFYGEYEYSYLKKGKKIKGKFIFTNDKTSISIKL